MEQLLRVLAMLGAGAAVALALNAVARRATSMSRLRVFVALIIVLNGLCIWFIDIHFGFGTAQWQSGGETSMLLAFLAGGVQIGSPFALYGVARRARELQGS